MTVWANSGGWGWGIASSLQGNVLALPSPHLQHDWFALHLWSSYDAIDNTALPGDGIACVWIIQPLHPPATSLCDWEAKGTQTGEPTPRTNLSCHDSSLWDPEMFRWPAKQNCWMWTFGWKIKRLRGMRKARTSHIPSSPWIQSNSSDSLTTALWALD